MSRFFAAALIFFLSTSSFAAEEIPSDSYQNTAENNRVNTRNHTHCDEYRRPNVETVEHYVWLRYKRSDLSAPPKVLTKNPGSAAGYVDYRVALTSAKGSDIPLVDGARIDKWNYPMVWVAYRHPDND